MLLIYNDIPPALNEGERLLHILTGNSADDLYTVVDDGMDVDEEIRFALRRKFGKGYRYEGYEDMSFLYGYFAQERDDAKAAAMAAWEGESYYIIGWSDGGEDWTSNGPVWFESVDELAGEIECAQQYETDTHLAYAEAVKQFEQCELDALLGDFKDDFDVDAIIEEATRVCDDGNRYWTAEGEELNEIIRMCEKK